jgi:hypothetical protein
MEAIGEDGTVCVSDIYQQMRRSSAGNRAAVPVRVKRPGCIQERVGCILFFRLNKPSGLEPSEVWSGGSLAAVQHGTPVMAFYGLVGVVHTLDLIAMETLPAKCWN